MDLFTEILSTKNTDPTPQTRMKTADLATAIVKENWNQKLPGYVKVEYILGEEGERTSDWIRVLHSYAGKDYGSYALPEVGSEVLVGFIMGDLNNAVVLGCLHNADNKLADGTADKDNNRKCLVTRGGHEISCWEEKGKEKLTVMTPGKLSVVMEDENQKIEIKDSSGKNAVTIDGKNGSISIAADKKIELTCGSAKLVLDGSGNKIEISAAQIKEEGSQALELSGQSLKAEGTSVEIKAKGTMKMEASGITQLKGSMVKIN